MLTTTSKAVHWPAWSSSTTLVEPIALAEQVDLGRAEQQHVDFGHAGARLVLGHAAVVGVAIVLAFLPLASVGRAAREPSGLPSNTRVIGLPGLRTVDLPTLTCTTGAISTRPQGAIGCTVVVTVASCRPVARCAPVLCSNGSDLDGHPGLRKPGGCQHCACAEHQHGAP